MENGEEESSEEIGHAEKSRSSQRTAGSQEALIGAEPEPKDVGYNQPNESDQPGKRHGSRHAHGGRE
jgi:hypothetical protein